ncbi:MAG: hypothetical protein BWY55_00885 [archaeon ADurb.Bin336]|nr:MAG: hypothetical protein BWY55_00885 [archaeon ADurb.Bin336]
MQATFFLKEVIANSEKKSSLVILSNKQMKSSLFGLIKEYSEKNKIVIIVSFFTPISEIRKIFGGQNIYFADCTQNNEELDDKVVLTTNPSDLTGIMVAIDLVEKKVAGNKVIIFDALNIMEAYNEYKKIGRFLHALSNKTKLRGNTLVLITEKVSTDPKTIDLAKQFSDKNYDYSSLFISTIASMETK